MNCFFKCKKVTNFALSQENKPEVTVQEFVFRYAINSCAKLKRQLAWICGGAINKSLLGTIISTGFGASILSKN